MCSTAGGGSPEERMPPSMFMFSLEDGGGGEDLLLLPSLLQVHKLLLGDPCPILPSCLQTPLPSCPGPPSRPTQSCFPMPHPAPVDCAPSLTYPKTVHWGLARLLDTGGPAQQSPCSPVSADAPQHVATFNPPSQLPGASQPWSSHPCLSLSVHSQVSSKSCFRFLTTHSLQNPL